MKHFNSNNVNLQRIDVKSKQLTIEQPHGILQQLLQYMNNKEKLKIKKLLLIN